jgi:hypothetical protein
VLAERAQHGLFQRNEASVRLRRRLGRLLAFVERAAAEAAAQVEKGFKTSSALASWSCCSWYL